MLFNTDDGPRATSPTARASRADVLDALEHFGLSSICNVLAAIKTAKLLGLGPDDAIDHRRHRRRRRCTRASGPRSIAQRFGGGFTDVDAAEVFGEHLADVDHRRT